MQTLTGINHRVADFDAWKQVYDGVRDLQREGGVRSYQVLRSADDSHRVYVTHVFDTREEAEAFLANGELTEAMERAGVDLSSVNVHHFELVEAGEI